MGDLGMIGEIMTGIAGLAFMAVWILILAAI